jgi:hypothetical protein
MNSINQLIVLKSEILCYGLKVNEEVARELNNQGLRTTKRFGMARGAKIILGNKLVVSAAFGNKYTEKSPLELVSMVQDWFVTRKNKEIIEVNLLDTPTWYFDEMADGSLLMDHVQLHSKNSLAASIYGGCDFIPSDACKFCRRNQAQNSALENLDTLSRAIAIASNQVNNCSLSLNTGYIKSLDRGAELFSIALQKIRQFSDLPIGVEMCPPHTTNYIADMIDKGMKSLTINIEFIDDKYRKQFCPGKSHIPKKTYFDAAEYVLSQLGKGTVSSVLIAGLTPPKEVIKGAEVLASKGIVPSICAFRPFDGTALEGHPTTRSSDLIKITDEVFSLMQSYGLTTQRDAGCIRCGACSLEGDFSIHQEDR